MLYLYTEGRNWVRVEACRGSFNMLCSPVHTLRDVQCSMAHVRACGSRKTPSSINLPEQSPSYEADFQIKTQFNMESEGGGSIGKVELMDRAVMEETDEHKDNTPTEDASAKQTNSTHALMQEADLLTQTDRPHL